MEISEPKFYWLRAIKDLTLPTRSVVNGQEFLIYVKWNVNGVLYCFDEEIPVKLYDNRTLDHNIEILNREFLT